MTPFGDLPSTRHPNLLNKDTTVIVVIDLQGTLFRITRKPDQLLDRLAILMETAKLLGVPVVVTEHYPKGLGTTDPEAVKLLPAYSPLEKTIFSCCGTQEFDSVMAGHAQKGRHQVVVAGIETHICVNQTVHDLLAWEFQVHIATDCLSSRFKPDHKSGIRKMLHSGALPTTAEAAAFELFYEATSPEFKQFARWLKEHDSKG